MSSPIAKQHRSRLDQALITTHQKLSHSRRIEQLAGEFARRLERLRPEPGAVLRVLDVGCGDMTLADAILARCERVQFACVDVHPCPPELAEQDERWLRYRRFDGRELPFQRNEFDVIMFADVLHHVPAELRVGLLASAARTGRAVLIKDHFEYGFVSRQALRAMDFVGNFGYGISVPERYFDEGSFAELCECAGLASRSVEVGLELYEHLPLLRTLFRPEWHFFATCAER
jgi:SAM-dependent methyltransferase